MENKQISLFSAMFDGFYFHWAIIKYPVIINL